MRPRDDQGHRGIAKLVQGGEQIELPCRYCRKPAAMTKHLIEWCQGLSVKYLEKRGQPPIRKDEIAVCSDCRPRYLDEFFPDTVEIVVPRATEEPPAIDDSTDGFGPPDHQEAMSF